MSGPEITSDCFYRYNDERVEQNVQEFANFANARPACNVSTGQTMRPRRGTCNAIIDIKGRETELNFWPHKSKGQFKYEKGH